MTDDQSSIMYDINKFKRLFDTDLYVNDRSFSAATIFVLDADLEMNFSKMLQNGLGCLTMHCINS